MPEKLPLLFSELFEAPIWEMHQSEDLLLIATRDEKKLEVLFSLFDLKSLTFLWKEILFEETWWIGVSHFYRSMIVFHTYANDQNFEKKSILGFQAIDQEVIWVLENVQPISAYGHLMRCSRNQGEDRLEFGINCQSGQELSLEELLKLSDKKEPSLISYQQLYPLHYVEGSKSFDSVAQYLKVKLNASAIGACDYLEWADKVIVSFFEDFDGSKENRLVVFDSTGETVHSEILGTSLTGLAADTFFIASEALIFVKNRSRLEGFSIGV